MRLTSFRIRNYKCFIDTRQAEVPDLVCLVGKNESGKSALLEALAKLNAGASFDDLEFAYDQDVGREQVVLEATFAPENGDAKKLSKLYPRGVKPQKITVKKRRNGEYEVGLEPSPLERRLVNPTKLVNAAKQEAARLRQIDQRPPEVSVARFIDEFREPFEKHAFTPKSGDKMLAELRHKAEGASDAPPETQQELSNSITTLTNIAGELAAESVLPPESVTNVVVKAMPKLEYRDAYPRLPARFNLTQFLEGAKADSNDLADEHRAVASLFSLANMKPEQLRKVTPSVVRRRCDEASGRLTRRLREAWHQAPELTVELKTVRDEVEICVRDSVSGGPVRLDQRSKGFRWFFSFYVCFLAEGKREGQVIYLFDEPGLDLHPSAQHDFVATLAQLSKDAQVFYTTHSPHMLPGQRPESIFILKPSPQGRGQVVSNKYWEGDMDTLAPLRDAIGIGLADSMFVSKYNLVVEGASDRLILCNMSRACKEKGEESLKPEVTIVPDGGASGVPTAGRLLLSNKLEVAALLDRDRAGRTAKKNLLKAGLQQEKVLWPDGDEDDEKSDFELEMLLTESFYCELVSASHGVQVFTPEDLRKADGASTLVKRVADHLKSIHARALCKTGAARKLADFVEDEQVPKDALDGFSQLFGRVNKTLGLAASESAPEKKKPRHPTKPKKRS